MAALPAAAQELAARQLNVTTRPGTEQRYVWENNAWRHLGTLNYTYNAAGYTTQTLATTSGDTQPSLRTLDTYNAQNQPLTSTDQLWQNGQWTDDFRVYNTYDAAGNIILKEEQIPSGSGWETTYAERYTYTYNSAGHITHELRETFEDSAWHNWHKADYVRGANGGYTEGIFWNWTNNAWERAQRQTDVVWHDVSTNRREKYTVSFWNDTTWVPTERYTLTYGQYESVEQIMELRAPNGPWVPMSRLQVNYDQHQNDLEVHYEINQGSGWHFMFRQLYTHTYDANQNLTETILQYRDETMPALVNEARFEYTDFQQINSTDDLLSIELAALPNPATDRLQISTTEPLKSVSLFDLSGRQVLMQSVAANSQTAVIQLQQLPSGVYLLRAETANGIAQHKVVKQ